MSPVKPAVPFPATVLMRDVGPRVVLLLRKFVLPPYEAVITSTPAGNAVVVSVAVPFVTVPVPSVVLPLKKVTIPLDTVAPTLDDTVAVKTSL